MITCSIQHPAQPSAMSSRRTRVRLATRSVRAPSIRQRVTAASRCVIEAALSMDDVIAHYLADQPPQLYRGGA